MFSVYFQYLWQAALQPPHPTLVKMVNQHNPRSNSGEKTVVVVATSGESNPFSYVKDGELTGYDVEVVRQFSRGFHMSFRLK